MNNLILEAREQATLEKCMDLCTDVYNACKIEPTSINMSVLVNKHRIKYDAVLAIKNLKIVEVLGSGQNTKYKWTLSKPDDIIIQRVIVEMKRIEANKSIKSMPADRKLIPIIRPSGMSIATVDQTLRQMYSVYGEGRVIDPTKMTSEFGSLPIGIFTSLESVGALKKSMVPGMFVWSGDKPSSTMAELIFEDLSAKKLSIKPAKGSHKPIERMLLFILAINRRIKEATFSMTEIINEFGVSTSTGRILQDLGIVKSTGTAKNTAWTWTYTKPIDMKLAADVRNLLAQEQRERTKKNDNVSASSTKPISASTNGIMDDAELDLQILKKIGEKYVEALQSFNDAKAQMTKSQDQLDKCSTAWKMWTNDPLPTGVTETKKQVTSVKTNTPDKISTLAKSPLKMRTKDRILERMTGEPFITTKQLMIHLNDLSEPTIYGHLKDLVDDSHVIRISSGKYKLNN